MKKITVEINCEAKTCGMCELKRGRVCLVFGEELFLEEAPGVLDYSRLDECLNAEVQSD